MENYANYEKLWENLGEADKSYENALESNEKL